MRPGCVSWRGRAIPVSGRPASVSTIGIAAFPLIVVALVDFDGATYQSLLVIRDAIYARLGLVRQHPFIGHITLGYVEIHKRASATQRRHAQRAIALARSLFGEVQSGGAPMTFGIDRASVFTFPHMSRFEPYAPEAGGAPRQASSTG